MHFILFTVIVAAVAAAALALYAFLKHLSYKDAAKKLIFFLTTEGSKLDSDLLAKIHALENGGHLAAGTTQKLVEAQTGAPTPTTT